MSDVPYIKASTRLPEITLRGLLLAWLLTSVLATANAYLALKLGILTSASIPAAIASMGVLRFFKNPSVLEHNAIQTAASAGEAVAGGIVYTIPALVIIGFWQGFSYWENVAIALTGGVLGVLFSVPLRKFLVHDPGLRFPEGRAIAEVLKSNSEQKGLADIVLGGAIGAGLELLQNGFKLLAADAGFWWQHGLLFGFGIGFSATMLGAGYMVGSEMAFSILLGAVLAWGIGVPVASYILADALSTTPSESLQFIWGQHLRYLGIGAMLFAGLWTLFGLLKPLYKSVRQSMTYAMIGEQSRHVSRHEADMPFSVRFLIFLLAVLLLGFLFSEIFPTATLGLAGVNKHYLLLGAMAYVLCIGFIFSVITAYFSGMVGVTASPGSSVVIAGMLFAGWLVLSFLYRCLPMPLDAAQLQAAEAITIIVGSVVTGIAAIANDNTQDLKVGQLLGATPWRQQAMLLFGVVISSLVIPPVMQLLFKVYGIAGVVPTAGMDVSKTLPAPTAAVMATLTQAVFHNHLPWSDMLQGAGLIVALYVLHRMLALSTWFKLSLLGVAIGMYLPLSSSFPLFLGGLLAFVVEQRFRSTPALGQMARKQRGILLACGMVAGSALMDVFLAVPFSWYHSPDALALVGVGYQPYGIALSALVTVALLVFIYRRVMR